MASARSVPYEENLTCPICLDVFTEPVSTPCGHNYCKVCITEYWTHSDRIQCPMCKESFHRRPKLRVNTGFKDVVEHFKKMRVNGSAESPAEPGDVPCDVCSEVKLKALKSCLVCQASYCHSHLEPHQRVAALKKHKLIDPVENLEDWVCEKHNKTFELFCRRDQMCVCVMCLKCDHATHETVPLEEEFRDRKAQLETMMSEIKNTEQAKRRNIWETNFSKERSKKDAEKVIADVVEVFAALLSSVQKSQTNLVEFIEEKQRVAEKQAEDFITELERDVTELQGRRTELERLSHARDPLCFLQRLRSLSVPPQTEDPVSLSSPPFTKDSSVHGHICVAAVRKAVAQLEETLSKETERLIGEAMLHIACEADEVQMTDIGKEMEILPQDNLMMIQQCHAVDVTLDADTAFPNFILSADGKQLRWCHDGLIITDPRRFDQPYALGKEGFSSGRFYYEVQLQGETNYVLGVAKESLNKRNIIFVPEFGCWSLPVTCSQFTPRRIGVFVDHEEAEVSFYDVDARIRMYSFTGCNFTERAPGLKALYYSWTGNYVSSRLKLYPIVGMFCSSTIKSSLTITQPHNLYCPTN